MYISTYAHFEESLESTTVAVNFQQKTETKAFPSEMSGLSVPRYDLTS